MCFTFVIDFMSECSNMPMGMIPGGRKLSPHNRKFYN